MTTTINNHLTLIERVGGIERAKAIVEGAPDSHYCTGISDYTYGYDDDEKCPDCVGIQDLRIAIEHHYYGRSEAEELAAYAELSQEKIEGGAMLVGDFSDARKIINKQLESDHVTDITNHISPNTKVVEL